MQEGLRDLSEAECEGEKKDKVLNCNGQGGGGEVFWEGWIVDGGLQRWKERVSFVPVNCDGTTNERGTRLR